MSFGSVTYNNTGEQFRLSRRACIAQGLCDMHHDALLAMEEYWREADYYSASLDEIFSWKEYERKEEERAAEEQMWQDEWEREQFYID